MSGPRKQHQRLPPQSAADKRGRLALPPDRLRHIAQPRENRPGWLIGRPAPYESQGQKRRDGQVVPEHENPKEFHKPHSDKNKFHEIFYYDIEKLNDDLAYRILDWLAFKQNVEHIPIVTDGEPRFKEEV